MPNSHCQNLLDEALESLRLQREAYLARMAATEQYLRITVQQVEDGEAEAALFNARAACAEEEAATGDRRASWPLLHHLELALDDDRIERLLADDGVAA